jgi:transposase InsO family protein
MGQVLHGCATTTEAIRRAIQHSQASLRSLSRRYGINPKTVAKWKKRRSVADLPTGPKAAKSTVLSIEDEAVVVAFRRHTLLPLDDCLYALQATIPHLTRSSLHRCLQRHGISRLPEVEDGKTNKRRFKTYPIGYFHIDIAEVRTEQGRLYLFVAIDRTSKFAFTELHERATTRVAADFLRALIGAVPYKIHTVLTDNGIHFTDPARRSWNVAEIKGMIERKEIFRAHSFELACAQNDIDHRLTKPKHPWTNGPGRAHEPDPQRGNRQTLLLRDSRSTPKPPCRLRQCLQLRQASQDPQRSHTLRVHLQDLDKRTGTIHPQSAPSNARTKHLASQAHRSAMCL